MPEINIQGKKLPRIDAVQMSIGLGGADARQLPQVSASFSLPADNDSTLIDWALTPQGEQRFRKVEIQTYDRSNKLNKTWTLAKAYVASLSETESGEGQVSTTSVTIVGTLIHATEDYNGKNILDVKPGQVESVPG